MKFGEVCLETNDVIRLANFYKWLLDADNGSNDENHQFIIKEEPMLTVYNDGTKKDNNNRNISLAFTVDDVDAYYEKLKAKGVEIIQPPMTQPWGAVNMSFYDPDRNVVYLRCIKNVQL